MTVQSGLPAVAVVHSPGGAANLREIYAASRGVCSPILVLRESVVTAWPDVADAASRIFGRIVVCPDGDVSSTLRSLSPEGMVTFHDGELDVTDLAMRDLALPGRPNSVSPWDKYFQRKALNLAGLSSLKAVKVDSVDHFIDAVGEVGLPAVLKPRRGVGGRGVAFVTEQNDVVYQRRNRRSWQGLLLETALPRAHHPSGSPWMGDFVSVESISSRAGCKHIAVFDKLPVSVCERQGVDGADLVRVTGDTTPTRLPVDVLKTVLDLTEAALDVLNVGYRVTHTEVSVAGETPEIIEVNGRVGGHLSRVLRVLDGPDLVQASLYASFGQDSRDQCLNTGYAGGIFMPFPSPFGPVKSQVDRRQIRKIPNIVGVDEVAKRGQPRSATGSRMCNVTIRADTAAEFDDAVPRTLRQLAELFRQDGSMSDRWIERAIGADGRCRIHQGKESAEATGLTQ